MPAPDAQEPTIVCDAGPLIALAEIQMLSLLQGLYSRVLVPEAVYRELTAPNRFSSKSALFDLPWLERKIAGEAPEPLLSAELGPGEAETITLALRTGAQRVLIDERK